jgi:hypothetical protein
MNTKLIRRSLEGMNVEVQSDCVDIYNDNLSFTMDFSHRPFPLRGMTIFNIDEASDEFVFIGGILEDFATAIYNNEYGPFVDD